MARVGPFNLDAAMAYADRLRGHPAQINSQDWRVDWDDAPHPFKLYNAVGADEAEFDYSTASDELPPTAAWLLRLLITVAGVSRVRIASGDSRMRPRRPVASGGALYPTELYAVVTGTGGDQPGIFHVDTARHGLTLISDAQVGPRLARAIGLPAEAPLPPAAVVLAHQFWKNAFKYGEFAYRLGAVDLGVVLGRLLRRLRDVGETVRLHLDLNSAADALVGLDGTSEAAYAIVLVSTPQTQRALDPPPTSRHLVALERSSRVKVLPGLSAMHAAAAAATAQSHRDKAAWLSAPDIPGMTAVRQRADKQRRVRLPSVQPMGPDDLHELPSRTSSGRYFNGEPATAEQLSRVLRDAATVPDLARTASHEVGLPRPLLYCAVIRVADVMPGWYVYVPAGHFLAEADSGRAGCRGPGPALRRAMRSPVLNVELAAFAIFIADQLDFRSSVRGARQYRVQQMFAGAAADGVTVAATVSGLGSHPLLGFDAGAVDRCLALPPTVGVLVEVCVGPVRPAPVLEGAVW